MLKIYEWQIAFTGTMEHPTFPLSRKERPERKDHTISRLLIIS